MPCCFKQKDKNAEELNKQLEIIRLELVPKEESVVAQDVPPHFGPGYLIWIDGHIKNHCPRFSIDLKSDKTPDADIILHINPRLALHYVVRNTKQSSCWGDEETNSVHKYVNYGIKPKTDFTLKIYVIATEYLIIFNGKNLCQYKHRISPNKVKVVEACGMVDVKNIKFEQTPTFPEKPFELEVVPSGESLSSIPSEEMKTPLTYRLENFTIGKQLEIYGRVKILPQYFYINLQDGGNYIYPNPEIHLHFNPRFNTIHGRLYIVCNAHFGKWGPEQRISNCAMLPYTKFSLAFRRDINNFIIVLDGKIIGEFKYRADASNVNTIHIQGDIVVNQVYLNNKVDEHYNDKHIKVESPPL